MIPSPATGARAPRGRKVAFVVLIAICGCRKPAPPQLLRAELSARSRQAHAAVEAHRSERPEPAKVEEPEPDAPAPKTLAEQREMLFRRMERELELGPERMAEVRRLFEASKVLGQGNPAASKHKMTRAQCRAARAAANEPTGGDSACGARHMVRIYNPAAGETADSARVCIDQYEFPSIPCEYPVVYARANQAAELCRAVGKRICDAHEWEGACAGALRTVEEEYLFGKERPLATHLHNQAREKVWAYGKKKDHARCATSALKSDDCISGSWTKCGTNTFPAGAFPGCKSAFGVYDQHGNAAEHMNLPLRPEELASRGGTGQTEMKGSWFAFQDTEAHEDDCRWRAKDWHPSALTDPESHRNYHLGFRCCRDL